MTDRLIRLHLWVLTHVSSAVASTDPRSVVTPPVGARGHRDDRGDAGQATAEYALVLLGAALVALLLVAWAGAGGGGGKIGQLLDRVVDSITSRV